MTQPEVIRRVLRAATWCPVETLASTLELAVQIAGDTLEGRPAGALFVLGDADAVLEHSRPLILDPLAGHAPAGTHLGDPRLRGTVKALAQLDGAFVVALDGTVVAACRYLDVPAEDVEVPLGLGSRHVAAAAVSKHLRAIGVVASQSGVIRVFAGGELRAQMRARADR